ARGEPELRELVPETEERLAGLEEELRLALAPSDPADRKDVIVEIRQGVGGDEAALWAGDLYRMLTRYAEGRGFKVEDLGSSPNDGAGFKEVTFAVKGDGAFSVFKYEGGTHRVQRVPETESQGRIHTSTATVAVMPEVEDVEIAIEDKDLKIDVFRSTGPGGQSVNTTDSAVRVRHPPTGIAGGRSPSPQRDLVAPGVRHPVSETAVRRSGPSASRAMSGRRSRRKCECPFVERFRLFWRRFLLTETGV